jgi:hypothetical protein
LTIEFNLMYPLPDEASEQDAATPRLICRLDIEKTLVWFGTEGGHLSKSLKNVKVHDSKTAQVS